MKKMIAVASSDGKRIDEHFGKARDSASTNSGKGSGPISKTGRACPHAAAAPMPTICWIGLWMSWPTAAG